MLKINRISDEIALELQRVKGLMSESQWEHLCERCDEDDRIPHSLNVLAEANGMPLNISADDADALLWFIKREVAPEVECTNHARILSALRAIK